MAQSNAITISSLLKENSIDPLMHGDTLKSFESHLAMVWHEYLKLYIPADYEVMISFSNNIHHNYAMTQIMYSNHKIKITLPHLKRIRGFSGIKLRDLQFTDPYHLIAFMYGLVEHELAHILYTYSDTLDPFERAINKDLLLMYFWQVLEDARIEYLHKSRYSFVEPFIDFMNETIFPIERYDFSNDHPALFLFLYSYTLLLPSRNLPPLNPDLERKLNQLHSAIPLNEIYKQKSVLDLYDYALTAYTLFKKFYPDYNPMKPQHPSIQPSKEQSKELTKSIEYYFNHPSLVELVRHSIDIRRSIQQSDTTTKRMNLTFDDTDTWPDLYANHSIKSQKRDIIKGFGDSPPVIVRSIKINDISDILSDLKKSPEELITFYQPDPIILSNAKQLQYSLERLFKFLDERFKYNKYSSRGHTLSKRFIRIVQSEITGMPPQIFRKRESKTRVDINLIILFDMSSSMGGSVNLLKNVGLTLLHALEHFRQINIGIYGFRALQQSGKVDNILNLIEFKPLDTPISKINFALINSIAKCSILLPEGFTPISKTLQFISTLLMQRYGGHNSAIIILTDGLENTATDTDIQNVMSYYDIPVYAIYYNDTIAQTIAERLKHLFKHRHSLATTYEAVMDDFRQSIQSFIEEVYIGNNY